MGRNWNTLGNQKSHFSPLTRCADNAQQNCFSSSGSPLNRGASEHWHGYRWDSWCEWEAYPQGTRLFKLFINLFLERVEGKEKERMRNIDVKGKTSLSCLLYAPQLGAYKACALIGNWTIDFLVYGTMFQPTEPYQSGQELIFVWLCLTCKVWFWLVF